MNINSSIRNLRYAAPQNLEKNIVEEIKEEVIEEAQTQPLQESTVEQGYGNASSQQYLANMGIKIVTTSRAVAPTQAETLEDSVADKQIEANTTQISDSRTADVKDTTKSTTSSSTTVNTKAVPHTLVATAAVISNNGSSIGNDLYRSTGEVIQEFLRKNATTSALTEGFYEIEQLQQVCELCLEDPLYIVKMQEEYLTFWESAHSATEFSSEIERGTSFIMDFCNEKLGINLTSLAKCAGGAAIASLLVKIGVSTVIDVAPDMGRDVFNLGKKRFKNLFKLNIVGLAKNAFIDAPVLMIRNMGRSIKALAKNTYQTARGIVVAGVSGTYNTVKTAVEGTVNTISKPVKAVVKSAQNVISGIGSGISKLADGNIIGAVGSVVGGVAKGVGNLVSGVASAVGSAVSTGIETVSSALKTVGNVVEEVLGNPVKAVGNAVKTVGKAIGKLFKGW